MSEALVPNRLLMHFEVPIGRLVERPKLDGRLSCWTEDHLLPDLCLLEDQEPFAEVYMGWRDDGLYVACHVEGKSQPPQGRPQYFWKADHLRLMTDMRDARNIKRATRYCQQFYFLPVGAGSGFSKPSAGTSPIHRAQESAPEVPRERIEIASAYADYAWALEAHIPADCLNGFDPTEHPRIGICAVVEDRECGQQFMTVDDELNWYIDPSLWATGVLVD